MRVLPGILACLAITDLLSNTAAHPDQHFHHHNGDDEESRELSLERCHTAEPTDEEIAESKRVMAKYAKQGLPRVKNIAIPTYFHEITDGQTGSLTDAEIDESIAVLNVGFGSKFTFNLVGKTVNNNAFWYTDPNSETELKTALKVGGCETLNIYSTSGHGYLGYAYFPYSCNGFILDGVVIASTTKPGGNAPFDQGKTLTHEVCHWLGLYHTFQNACSGDGDEVDDTPAHAAPDFECIAADTCPSLPGANPIENFMNYTPDDCMNEFTPNQIDRMDTMWTEYRNTGSPSPPTPPSPVTSPVIPPVTSPVMSPVTSPVISPVTQPTSDCVAPEVELRVEVTTDIFFSETGWNITDGNEIIMEVAPLFYGLPDNVYKESVCLSAPPDCLIFTMIDSFGDGILGSDNFKVYSDKLLKYSSGNDFSWDGDISKYLYSKTVNVIDGGCVSNPVASPPTLAPITPTLAPITPTPAPVASPTTNCVATEVELRVEVTTDSYPTETGWSITDGNEIIMEVAPSFYSVPDNVYKESVCLSAPPDCLIFTMIDSFGDGILGSDNFKVYLAEEVKYSSGNNLGMFMSKTVNVIDFGCVSNPVASPPTLAPITPTLAPITPTVAPITPTVAPITPTVAPTQDNCPFGASMFRADVFTDNNGDKIKIVVKKKNKNNKWRGKVVYKDDLESNTMNTFDACLSNLDCYRFVISDRDRDGLCCEAGLGFYSVRWKGEEIKYAQYKNGRRKFTKFNCGPR